MGGKLGRSRCCCEESDCIDEFSEFNGYWTFFLCDDVIRMILENLTDLEAIKISRTCRTFDILTIEKIWKSLKEKFPNIEHLDKKFSPMKLFFFSLVSGNSCSVFKFKERTGDSDRENFSLENNKWEEMLIQEDVNPMEVFMRFVKEIPSQKLKEFDEVTKIVLFFSFNPIDVFLDPQNFIYSDQKKSIGMLDPERRPYPRVKGMMMRSKVNKCLIGNFGTQIIEETVVFTGRVTKIAIPIFTIKTNESIFEKKYSFGRLGVSEKTAERKRIGNMNIVPMRVDIASLGKYLRSHVKFPRVKSIKVFSKKYSVQVASQELRSDSCDDFSRF